MTRIVKLGSIATLSNGISQAHDPDGELVSLQISDFKRDGSLDHTPKRVEALSARQERHLLRPGDVLFGAKGTNNRAFLYPETAGPAVASTVFIVIRLLAQSGLQPEYLQWWLNLPATQADFQKMAKGSNIPSISMETLLDLEIPAPSLERQDLILQLQRLIDREHTLMLSIAQKRHQIATFHLIKSTKS